MYQAVSKVRQMMSQRQMMLSGMSEGTIDKDTKSGTGSPTQALAQALGQLQMVGLGALMKKKTRYFCRRRKTSWRR